MSDATGTPLNIEITEAHRLPIEGALVPKGMTPLDGKLYFVDIGGKSLNEYDPKTQTTRKLSPGGDPEFTTALGVNMDGSLIVARNSGVYYVKPGKDGAPDDWHLACKLDMENRDNERVNNGVMVPTTDRHVRFMLGTCAIDPDKAERENKRPGRLMMMEERNGKMEMIPLGENMMTVNALSGQIPFPNTGVNFITYADSWKTAGELKVTEYSPHRRALLDHATTTLVDFKQGQKTTPNGRPDGTSPVMFGGEHAVVVAAIDSNEIRVYPLTRGEKKANEPIAKFTLPANINKPTMMTFTTENDRTVGYITAFEMAAEKEADAEGKEITKQVNKGAHIYRIDSDELQAFKPIENIGTYPSLEEVRSAAKRVSADTGGFIRGGKKNDDRPKKERQGED